MSHVSDRVVRPARTAVWEHDNSKDVLLVLDPNGLHCWEDVSIDNFTNSTLLTFLHTLDDALTVGRSSGSPLPMRVSLLAELVHCLACQQVFLLLAHSMHC